MYKLMGGIHLRDNKITKDNAIVDIKTKERMVFPVRQHIGKPANIKVKVGDYVKVGEILAEATDGISASVISSVSGIVENIDETLLFAGGNVMSIIVKNDFKDEKIDGFGIKRDYKTLTKEEMINIIKNAGIVGLGGATFPTHIKLSPKNPDAIDYVLVNACECEPYLTSDYRLLLEKSDDIIMGLEVVLKLFPFAKGIICIEDNKKKAYNLILKKLNQNASIYVSLLKTKYPEGGERQLIYAVTGRKLNSDMLPADLGAIVINTDTTIAIKRAICDSEPLTHRVMTLTGDAFLNPGNYRVPFGISYKELIEEVGGFKNEPIKLVSGGPMMGQSFYNLDAPVTKNSSAILSFTKVEKYKTTYCINCGRCIDACPISLMPTTLYKKSKKDDIDSFIKLNGKDCIECGCCSYVCPAKLPLTATFKEMKVKSRKKEIKK